MIGSNQSLQMKPIEDQSLFRTCKTLVLCGGMWRGDIPNWPIARQKLYKVFLRGAQFVYFFCLPSLVISLWVNVGKDNGKVISVLKNITFVFVIFCKIIIIQSRRVTMLIEAASEKEQEAILSGDSQISEIHRRHFVYTEFVVKSIMLCTFLAGLAYVVGDLYLANDFYKTHPNAAPTDPKPHSIYFWFPFNPDEYYKTALIYEFVHIVQTVIYNGASHAVVNSALIFVNVELKILEYGIRHMMSKPNLSNLTPAQLIKIHIRKHQELINWVHKFNDSFKFIILLEYCVISLTLASTLTEILQGIKVVFNGIFCVLSTLSLFILAWNANEIIVTSVFDLSDALYHFPWYELDKESQELVLFMMLRCKRSLNISNGPFGILTLNGAVSRLKLAYSVVSVLSR